MDPGRGRVGGPASSPATTARSLLRVFQLQERLKAPGPAGRPAPRLVHVVGGGVMGGDIAAWCALQGCG